MRYFVTGSAGFIGSHLTERLLSLGHQVVGYDNLVTGRLSFINHLSNNPKFQFFQADLADKETLASAMAGCNFVYHLAANADVRHGTPYPYRDLEQNTLATFNVLEAMRKHQIRQIAFTSTSAVYGDQSHFPISEDAPFPIQTSFHGASKVAAEGLITAYCEGFDFKTTIFRFACIVGERYHHGHLFDFFSQLQKNPNQLHILGNGEQKRQFVYISDCIDAILLACEKSTEKVGIFNVGTEDFHTINQSADWVAACMGLNPTKTYSGGPKGWRGDNLQISLDCTRLYKLGWYPKVDSQTGVEKTIRYFLNGCAS